MRTFNMVIGLLLLANYLAAQTAEKGLAKAMQTLLKDEQLKHASVSLYVAESKTGKPVYGYNEEIGLAPASTQKIFTAIAALETLGEQYRYKTEIGYKGKITNNMLHGYIVINPSCDPTLGSWRYNSTKPEKVLSEAIKAFKAAGIEKYGSNFSLVSDKFETQAIPDGWIWQDVGNYYGAGCYPFNWRENQVDIHLKSGSKTGDSVAVGEPNVFMPSYLNELKTAAPGTGDNAYFYLNYGLHNEAAFRGTIPVNQTDFKISIAAPDVFNLFQKDWSAQAEKNKLSDANYGHLSHYLPSETLKQIEEAPVNILYTHYSPTLDSIVYWFLQKSINLYGEALLKTMAYEKTGFGSTQKGIEVLNKFWKERGIEESALNIMDGSGLSPQNRVTTKAMVTALQYAKDKSWFKSFYAGLPVYNGMRMKSGSIGGARAYTGYHTSASGVQYSFAIMVNNYSGSAGAIVQKMYKVLNELK